MAAIVKEGGAEYIASLQLKLAELQKELKRKDIIIENLKLLQSNSGKEQCYPALDISSDKREMLTAERTTEIFESKLKEIEDYTQVKKVKLGTKSFGLDAAKEAAKFIQKLPNLVEADFADIIAGRPEAEALQVLSMITSSLPLTVENLDLSDNALGEKGIRTLSEFLSSLTNLKALTFANNGLSMLSIELIDKALSKPQILEILQFDNNMSGDDGAIVLSQTLLPKCINLKNFRMSSSRVRVDGGIAMINQLCNLTSLHTLNLSDSMFGVKGAEALVAALPKLSNLTTLNLRDTGLDEEGVDLVVKCLTNDHTCSEVRILDLSCLEITAKQAKRLGEMLVTKLKLTDLLIEDNELKSRGAIALSPMLRQIKSLKVLNLSENQINTKGCIELAESLLGHECIETIQLNGNMISSEGVEKLQQMLSGIIGSLEDVESDDGEESESDLESESDAASDSEDELAQQMNKVQIEQ